MSITRARTGHHGRTCANRVDLGRFLWAYLLAPSMRGVGQQRGIITSSIQVLSHDRRAIGTGCWHAFNVLIRSQTGLPAFSALTPCAAPDPAGHTDLPRIVSALSAALIAADLLWVSWRSSSSRFLAAHCDRSDAARQIAGAADPGRGDRSNRRLSCCDLVAGVTISRAFRYSRIIALRRRTAELMDGADADPSCCGSLRSSAGDHASFDTRGPRCGHLRSLQPGLETW